MVRRGSSRSTREEIRLAAAALFGERGFARTSVRDIAARAQVNPALVIRHFATKELLFLETMRLTMDDEPLLDVPVERFGRRFVEVLLANEQQTKGIYLALVHGSGEPGIAQRLREVHEAVFIAPLLARLSGADAELRARLAAALVGGLLYALWVVGDEVLLGTDHRELVVRYGDMLQELLTPGG